VGINNAIQLVQYIFSQFKLCSKILAHCLNRQRDICNFRYFGMWSVEEHMSARQSKIMLRYYE